MDIKFHRLRFNKSVKIYKETKIKYPLDVYAQYCDIVTDYLFALGEYKKRIVTKKQKVEADKLLKTMKSKLDQLFETEIIDLLRNETVFSKLLKKFHAELIDFVKKNYDDHVLQFYAYLIVLVDFINSIYVMESAGGAGDKLSVSSRLIRFKETLLNQKPYAYIRPIEGWNSSMKLDKL
jgi:hypothetical protein